LAGPIDLGLLRKTAHSPSYFALTRGMSGQHGDLVDFCIPCNPYFPTPGMFEGLERNLQNILKYYPSDADTITAELCATLRLHPQTVAMGNGSTELITWIDHLLVKEGLAIPIPTFGRWTDQPLETGKRVDMFPLQESQDFELDTDAFLRFVRHRGSRVAVICNPNNPDGGYVSRREVIRLLDSLADFDLVVVDESFIDFVDAEPYTSVADEAAIRPNVIVLKSLGKNFGLHGIRFGYLVANPALAGTVRRALPKWNLNSFAEVVVFLLKEHQAEYRRSLELLAHDRRTMSHQLAALPGLTVFASQGNFVLVKLPIGKDGGQLRDYLIKEHGVFVRECGNKLGSSSQFLRLVVRPQADVRRLLTGLGAFLYDAATPSAPVVGAAVGEWRGSYDRIAEPEQVGQVHQMGRAAAGGGPAPGAGPVAGGGARPDAGAGWTERPPVRPLDPVVGYGDFSQRR
jgi:histidinol-phosphate/aromatic aminotransferase/cobyric acid decarboxylase-like protein